MCKFCRDLLIVICNLNMSRKALTIMIRTVMQNWLGSYRENCQVVDQIGKASSNRRAVIEDIIRILEDPDYLNNPIASATLACVNDIVSPSYCKL